jgi:predicted nucleic acid-binding protein
VIVLDASAVADALLDAGPRGEWARTEIAAADGLAAPHLLDVEVASVARNRALRREVPRRRASDAVDDLARLRVRRYAATPLLHRIWELSGSLTAYDAVYVALAEALGCALVTTDLRLARTPRLPVRFRTPPGAST